MNIKVLYRPVGEKEMILIAESDYKIFPPRLEWQPIFYPVLNEEYASEIAEKWNTRGEFGNYLGFVTQFQISEEEFQKYEVQNVGARNHNEIWIPSEKLSEFNSSIIGSIEVIKVYVGSDFNKSNNEEIQKLLLKHKK